MALDDYNLADRMVHRIAFGTAAPQQMLLEMEQRQFGDRIEDMEMGPPIFITALPRAGTTLTIELLARHPDVATHTYRDMPFVASPLIWQKLSRQFQVRQQAKERSHGDGMMVSTDSPEAFEEVLWKRHFPQDFDSGTIPLHSSLPAAFVESLRRHMRAICLARGLPGSASTRYASKNNANIARIEALATAFPDARIIVPLRHPVDQARSLLHQHQKALKSHSENRFVRSYVRDIGHFEFGAEHKPLAFEGLAELSEGLTPDSPDYWLAYWIAAARHIQHCGKGEILDMEHFTNSRAVGKLYAALGLESAREAEQDAQSLVAPIKRYDEAHGGPLADEALALYEDMRQEAACLV